MINSMSQKPSAAPLDVSRNTAAQADFTLACAGATAKGVAVLPLGNPGQFNLRQIMNDALEQNGGEPLNQIVVNHTQGGPFMGMPGLIQYSVQQKHIAEGGTMALLGAAYRPQQLQHFADQNPGIKIAYQDPRTPKGVTVYEHGKEPRVDPEGSISDGGFGKRGCGTTPGYTPSESKPAEVSMGLI